MLLTQAKKIPARKVLGSDAGLRKFGSVSFGAMPSRIPFQSSDVAASCLVNKKQSRNFPSAGPGHADLEAEVANEEGAPMAEAGRVLFDFR